LSRAVAFISLDNDLGPSWAGQGRDVAKWIEEKAYNGEIEYTHWAIHTMNMIARREMRAALGNAMRFWQEHEDKKQQEIGTDELV